jgi:hypothetical protein
LDRSRVGTHKQVANDLITTNINVDDTLSKQVRVAAGFSCASMATRIKWNSKEEALQRGRIAMPFHAMLFHSVSADL